MANYNQLKSRAEQVRDEENIGANTALRVGQLLYDMVAASEQNQDSIGNLSTMYTGTEDNPIIETLPNPKTLHWLQSPIVALVSMGEDLDGDAGATLQEGDLYYWNHSGYQIFVKGAGINPGSGYKARENVLYLNKYTGKLYEWDGNDMSEIILAGVGGGGGNVTIEENQDYIDITIDDNVPVINVSVQSIVMSGNDKTATFTVSGRNLTAPIKITKGNAYFTVSPSTVSPVGGVVESTTVTVTFGGSADDTDDLIVSSVGASPQTVHVTYTAVAGPNIVVSPASLSFKAATGETETKSVTVNGSQLTADVVVTAGGAFQVSLSSGSGFANSVTVTKASALAGATVYVKYTAGSSATTGTLTLSSTGATQKSVTLTGAVAGTLSISPASASIGIVSGGSGTAAFTVQGENLTPASTASVAVSGTGMSADKQSLTVGQVGTINEVVTVTFTGSADSNGTLTVSHADVDNDATASVAGLIVAPLPVNASFKVDGIHYKVNSDQTSVRVWNGTSESGAASTKYSGAITIPASVSDSGVTANLDGGGTQVGAGCTYAVTQLATHAFSGCSSLTSLTLPEGLKQISKGAIRECKNSSFKTLVIPSTVNYIDSLFLWDCTYLETVEMRCYNNENWDSNNLSWGENNNGNCNKLTNLTAFTIPDGFTAYVSSGTYGNFYNCLALTEITLGKGLANFNDLFTRCQNITKIYCRSTTPPTINASSSNSFSIPTTVYENAQVFVPRGYVQAYLDAEDPHPVDGVKPKIWSLFNANNTLIEYDPD